jgi:hypothetical protein
MTERRTVLDWAEQIDSEPRATQRGTTWAELRAVARIPANPTPGEPAAREAAHADGLRQGYTQGWRWGLGCGVPLGALLAGVAWGLWLAARGIAP